VKCESPYQRRIGRYHELWQQFPCGRCLNCRINRAEEWTFRLKMELEDKTKIGDFVTLTMDEKKSTEEEIQWLDKRILQRFFKRVRKSGCSIKYFACGEYGEKHGRAHYHAIVIRQKGNPPEYELQDFYEEKWGYGNVKIGSVTSASARYVTGYLVKGTKIPSDCPAEAFPFQIQSQGIGKEWVLKHPTMHEVERENNGWIPKYYRDKIKDLPRTGDLNTASPLSLLILTAIGRTRSLTSRRLLPSLTQPEEMIGIRRISATKLEHKKAQG